MRTPTMYNGKNEGIAWKIIFFLLLLSLALIITAYNPEDFGKDEIENMKLNHSGMDGWEPYFPISKTKDVCPILNRRLFPSPPSVLS